LSATSFDCTIGDLGARVAYGQQCRVSVFDASVVLEVAIVFEEIQSAVEFDKEGAQLRMSAK
jgi:hypothetical protein